MTPVGIYARISRDSAGDGLGVRRQVEDCRALAARRRWRVVREYVDNDVSAYSGRPRPAFERLLADLAAGRVRGVVAWHTDRLHRSPLELERFVALVETTDAVVETVQTGPIDLATPSGRAVARTLGAWARFESEHKSERIRRRMEQNAREGKPHGSQRPFGWQADRVTADRAEVAYLRLAANRVLAGASIASVVTLLNERGSRNTRGGLWRDTVVRGVLLRPRNVALRVHRGEIVGPGQWESIMDRQVWDDVRRILLDPARVASPAGRTRRHLLSGIAVCGVCRAPVRATTIRTPGRDRLRRVYTCKARGCVVAEEAEVDAIVVAAVLARLARPDAATLVESRQTPDGRAVRRLAGLRRRQEEAATEYANGGITIGQLRTITRELEPQIEALEHRLAPPVPVISVLPDLIAGDTERVWATLDLRQQRSVISSLATVRILRAARPGPHSFNPKRVRVTCC